jgi:hypothetical protein
VQHLFLKFIMCRVREIKMRESSRDPILVTQRTSPRRKLSTKSTSLIIRVSEVVMLKPKMTLNVIDVALLITLLKIAILQSIW